MEFFKFLNFIKVFSVFYRKKSLVHNLFCLANKNRYSNRRLKSKGSTFFFKLALFMDLNFGSLPLPNTWKI